MFSIVATETSVLTFVSVPGLAYRSDWFFLQLAFGYIVGRILVSVILLPQYFTGNITSIYEILGTRFGAPVQKTASGIFLITRLFADGVRLLATAVVVQVVTGWPIWVAVLVIGVVTMVYTLSGGFRTILWVDSFQFILYLSGGVIVILFILTATGFPGWDMLFSAGKTEVFRFTTDNMFKDAWFFGSAFFGGTLLSFASHGADYMMVQRVLTCGNLSSAKKAMIGSGFFVFLQFAVFLLAGSLIWIYTGGIAIDKDRELSSFIVTHLPVGVKGILLAGVLSAAMSTLSSSINALASSTIHDWLKKTISLKSSMLVCGVWACLLILIAMLFGEGDTAFVVLGLKIASFTYGGLLGLFILSRSKHDFSTSLLIVGLLSSLGSVFFLQWLEVAWTWFIGAAVILNLVVVYGLYYCGWKRGAGLAGILILSGYFSIVNGQYQTGLEVLAMEEFSALNKKNIGVVVNHTSIDQNRKHLIQLAYDNGVQIKAVFTPEHGYRGVVEAGETVEDGIESLTGAPIYSLYGENKKPTPQMLSGLDVIVYDIQDIGVRYYTYISTLTYIIEAAAENEVQIWILDRVNPLGREVQGPTLEKEFTSFVGMHPIPVRHGMTFGELATMINEEGWLANGIQADLTVISYKGEINKIIRQNAFKPPPSPNMPDLETAWLYQGLCLLEGTNLSEGRGTDLPFKLVGAPWLDNKALADKLQQYSLPGDKYEITSFTPKSILSTRYPKYEGQECKGIRILTLASPLIWTMHLIHIIHDQHPEQFKFLETNYIDKLYGSDTFRLSILKDVKIMQTLEQFQSDEEAFLVRRKNYLIY